MAATPARAPLTESFASALTRLRIAAGDTRAAVALALEIDDSSVGYWERNYNYPSVENFEKLVQLYPALRTWGHVATRPHAPTGFTTEKRQQVGVTPPGARITIPDLAPAPVPVLAPAPILVAAPAPVPAPATLAELGIAYAHALRDVAGARRQVVSAEQALVLAMQEVQHCEQRVQDLFAALQKATATV